MHDVDRCCSYNGTLLLIKVISSTAKMNADWAVLHAVSAFLHGRSYAGGSQVHSPPDMLLAFLMYSHKQEGLRGPEALDTLRQIHCYLK